MIETIRLDSIKKKTKTLYEAVEIIAKRCKQINSLRQSEMDIPEEVDESIEESIDETALEEKVQSFEPQMKPISQALWELMNDEVEFRYPEEENEEKS